MMVLVIRESDNAVMDQRHDAPHPREGSAIKAAVLSFGGTPEDYREYIVPDSEKMAHMEAKELKWDNKDKRVKVVPFSGQEKKDKRQAADKATVEHELIHAQMYVDAAEKLGIDVMLKKAERERLKAQHEEIKEKEKKK